jgi:hypothetical protein
MSVIRRVARPVCLLLAAGVLLATTWLGIAGGVGSYRGAGTGGQTVAAVTQLLYGASAPVCLVALLRRASWTPAVLGAWAATLTVTGALSPIVWAGTGLWSGLAAGLLTALVAGAVCWCALRISAAPTR